MGCLQRIAGVLLDAENGELDGDVQGWVGDVGLLVAETHGADEACLSSDLVLALRMLEETYVRISLAVW